MFVVKVIPNVYSDKDKFNVHTSIDFFIEVYPSSGLFYIGKHLIVSLYPEPQNKVA
jgi:hypothetical protein